MVPLRHGADPTTELTRIGLRVTAWAGARRGPTGELWLDCEVGPGPPQQVPPASSPPPPVPHAEGLVIGPGESAVPVQRVSAVAVVRAGARGLLLTRYSRRTRRPGWWGLPGGGCETGEEPVAAAVRECWEETGHRVEIGRLLGVTSDHFVGRAPHGRLEDFHAIQLVYAGRVAEAVQPVVHDLDGSTDDAAWVSPAELASLTLTPMARRQLRLAGIEPFVS
ncbi:MAG: NUDIX domain-containing protein [Austwickia sp.]|nr:NUDIX domain-containing protein [Austwickia sp.]